jgi:hypothetical protein
MRSEPEAVSLKKIGDEEDGRKHAAIGYLRQAVLDLKPRFAKKVTYEQYRAAQEMLSDRAVGKRICKLLNLDSRKNSTVRKDASGTTYIEVER